MTRLWPEGQPITVTTDDQGQPLTFEWQGRSYRVAAITRRWRVDLGWWHRRHWRAYYKLYSDSGLLLIVYQNLSGGEWYVQRLYD